MIDAIKRWYNKIRIKFLETFTDRVKHIRLETPDGKTHDVTVERSEEKVCDHKTIREIAPTMWQCEECKDIYFQINYKVMVTRPELIEYLEKLAAHFETKLIDADITESKH